LTGRSRDFSSILLAVGRQAHALRTDAGGVHGVMLIVVAIIAIGLCGIIGSTIYAWREPSTSKPALLPQQMHRAHVKEYLRHLPKLTPELFPGGGFVVPQGASHTITVPALPAVPDPLFNFPISSKEGHSLFWGQYVSGKTDPFGAHSGAQYDACIAMSRLEDSRELGTIVVGKPPDSLHVEGHIKYGSNTSAPGVGFGILKKTSDPLHPFVLEGIACLYATVNGGQGNRTIRLFSEDNLGWHERACATAYVTGHGQAWYEVECYEYCDMLLASLTIMGVDRIDVSNLLKLGRPSWL
jgi:hypothetical protein